MATLAASGSEKNSSGPRRPMTAGLSAGAVVMGAMGLGSAFGNVLSGDMLMTAGLIVGGFYAAGFATDFLRQNVVDLGMKGADALYAVVGATVTMAFLPNQYARPLAAGMLGAGLETAAREYNVI